MRDAVNMTVWAAVAEDCAISYHINGELDVALLIGDLTDGIELIMPATAIARLAEVAGRAIAELPPDSGVAVEQ
ncbi:MULTISPECIES: hypothetical protein [Actinokineospora]|nr:MULTISPECIES: hypothetical protein [Actinokineospora]UVS76963.1 hypothetical protein Actkin_00661 [Actinokineospora sp. UTMC 2448]